MTSLAKICFICMFCIYAVRAGPISPSSDTAESAQMQTAWFQSARIESVQTHAVSVRRGIGWQSLQFNNGSRRTNMCVLSPKKKENESIGFIQFCVIVSPIVSLRLYTQSWGIMSPNFLPKRAFFSNESSLSSVLNNFIRIFCALDVRCQKLKNSVSKRSIVTRAIRADDAEQVNAPKARHSNTTERHPRAFIFRRSSGGYRADIWSARCYVNVLVRYHVI